jgi:hypothetical protein
MQVAVRVNDVPRVVKRKRYVCNLVAISGNLITARCGREYKRPKEGGIPPGVASFGHDCPDCAAETAAIKARFQAPG